MSALNNAPRLFESDLTPVTASIALNGKENTIRAQITAFGDLTSQGTDYVAAITGNTSSTACADHIRNIAKNYPELHHGNKQLRDHIQVRWGSEEGQRSVEECQSNVGISWPAKGKALGRQIAD